jgi:hypothetical protein
MKEATWQGSGKSSETIEACEKASCERTEST